MVLGEAKLEIPPRKRWEPEEREAREREAREREQWLEVWRRFRWVVPQGKRQARLGRARILLPRLVLL
jgi:hypothetical protein